jgi:hypothetical protein
MDADLIPLELPGKSIETRPFFLIAVPRKLVDRVVETLQYADLDLVRLQVGISAQLQHLAPLIDGLDAGTGVLHLDLLRDCTLASLLTAAGPIRLARLTSIRDFPDPPPRQEESAQSNLNVESQIIASDSYLPLSELDIRRLCQEITQFLADCLELYPGLKARSVVISGVNSAHPALEQLFAQTLEMPVQVSRSLATNGVGQFSSDDPIVLQSVGNLIGLGLSFLPRESMHRASADAVSDLELNQPCIEVEMEKVDPTPPQAAVVSQVELPVLKLLPKQVPPKLLAAHQELAIDPLPHDSPILEEEMFSTEESLSWGLETDDRDRPPLSIFTEDMDYDLEDAGSSGDSRLDNVDSEHSIPAEGLVEQEPIFSFAPDEPEVLADVVPPPVEMMNSEIHLEEDEDEVPFSMKDLLSSYQAKEVVSIEVPEMMQHDDLQVQDEEESAAYLHDDPSLWPSIAKVDQPLDSEQAEDQDG